MSDLISRQAAIDALNEVVKDYSITAFDAIASILDLPPAQPEIVRCEECLYRKICSWEKQGAKFCSFAEKREVTT